MGLRMKGGLGVLLTYDYQGREDEEDGAQAVVFVAQRRDEENGYQVHDPDWGEEEGEVYA